MIPMRSTFPVFLLLLTASTCAGRQSPDRPVAAETRVLPPIPSSAPTALGRIPITRVHDLQCNGAPAFGCFDRNKWTIELRDSMPLTLAWVSLYHEMAHAAFQSAGIEFDDPKYEDQVADAIGEARTLEMRAGWPR